MNLKKVMLPWALLLLNISSAVAQVQSIPEQIQKYGPREVEEFDVLKTDKKVRHGTYVRYMPQPFIGKVLFETGSYDHGRRQGEWRTYSTDKPWSIISVGTYNAGEKEGVWTYYHLFVSPPSAARANNSFTPKAGDALYINDTTAIVQAQGLYAQGHRVGVWTYFDWNKQVVQKINHFTNQLLYWRSATEPPANSIASTVDHPLLYAGGKVQLQREIFSAVGPYFALGFDKSMSAEFIYQVDATGKQIAVVPADAASLTRYKKQLLLALAKVPALWVPQVVAGKSEPALYRVKISIEVEKKVNKISARILVEPLGA